MPRDTDAIVLVVAGDHGVDKLAMYEAISRAARAPMIELVVADGALERHLMAAEAHIKLVKEFREIERHPRYRDNTPRSPKPRFRKR